MSVHIACAQADVSIKDFDIYHDMIGVTALVKASWSQLFWQPYDQKIIDFVLTKACPADIRYHDKKLSIKVMRAGSTIIGFATYFEPQLGICHIELLAIDQKYRGKGYGKKLIEYVYNECKAKNTPLLELCVYERNKPALDFYTHLNFAVAQRCVMPQGLPNYFILHKKIA